MSLTPDQYKEAEALIAQINDYITQSRALLAEGKEAALDGLQEMASMLGVKASALEPSQRDSVAERIEATMAALDALQEEMRARQAALMVDMQGLGSAHKASNAYLRTGANIPHKPEADNDG